MPTATGGIAGQRKGKSMKAMKARKQSQQRAELRTPPLAASASEVPARCSIRSAHGRFDIVLLSDRCLHQRSHPCHNLIVERAWALVARRTASEC